MPLDEKPCDYSSSCGGDMKVSNHLNSCWDISLWLAAAAIKVRDHHSHSDSSSRKHTVMAISAVSAEIFQSGLWSGGKTDKQADVNRSYQVLCLAESDFTNKSWCMERRGGCTDAQMNHETKLNAPSWFFTLFLSVFVTPSCYSVFFCCGLSASNCKISTICSPGQSN